jgi:hypothetical protein
MQKMHIVTHLLDLKPLQVNNYNGFVDLSVTRDTRRLPDVAVYTDLQR